MKHIYTRRFLSAMLKSTNEVKLASTIREPKSEKKGDIFFLHGLFGDRSNLSLVSNEKYVTNYFTAHLIDMRNHGDSDHCATMTYKEMALDVGRYAEERNIRKYTLCGHSMGGKIAMALAALRPDNISSIIVMDAPPKDVRNGIKYIGKTRPALMKMKMLAEFKEGQQWEDVVNEFYQTFTGSDTPFATLLERNLLNVDGKPVWKCNMKTIAEKAEDIFGYEDLGQYRGKDNVLVIMGAKSIVYSVDVFRRIFPNIANENIKVIQGAGHWVHADKLKDTQRAIGEFLKSQLQL
eukprot:TRINITY_DN10510_c0_g1_i4.p1 TRINITY_DN10510_c0_g1~~TRINITY_DN10510_c0_g1_i4.p1  ORF type:complete len:293 (-),score=96.82 TRINITY_DN10510_c0_g1_i4:145-1023(-)